MAANDVHCILLIQCGNDPKTRTFADFKNISGLCQGVADIYDQYLILQNPQEPQREYRVGDLLYFVDTMKDLSCLVYDKATNMYKPYNKAWIKEKVYSYYVQLEQLEYSLQ